MSAAERTAVNDLVPLLVVEQMDRSVGFYRGRLGFKLADEWKPDGQLEWCRLVRGGAAVMLQQACAEDGPATGRGRGVTLYLLCADADALHAEFRASGLELEPPTVAFYGMNQLYLQDPDGYQLCFQNPVG